MNKMAGRTALITGGASGLGEATARLLASEGAKVVITDLQTERGEQVASEIPGCRFIQHDVRDEAGWGDVVRAAIAHGGQLDTLVNNAGLVRFADVERLSYDDFRLQTEVMLNGTFLGCKAALPHMSKQGAGAIINMASIAALAGMAAIPAYAAAKAGIIGITRSVAIHCKEQGYRIRCNAIAPGGIETPMTAQASSELDAASAELEHTHSHGMGKPIDVANAVLYLASDDGRYVNGTTLVIDNGETAG